MGLVNIQRGGADGAAERRQCHICSLLVPLVEGAAHGPAGNGANGGLKPDRIVDDGAVCDDESISIHQLQQLGTGLCNGILVNGHLGHLDLAQCRDIGIGLHRAAGRGRIAGIGAVLNGILSAGIQLDIVHIDPALAVYQTPAVFQLGNGHTLAHTNGGHQAALNLGSVTDIDSHRAIGNGAVFLSVGGRAAGSTGGGLLNLDIGHANPAGLAFVIDAAPACAVVIADLQQLHLGAGGQGADLIQDADLRFAADPQIDGAGNGTGGNHLVAAGIRDGGGIGVQVNGAHIHVAHAGQAQTLGLVRIQSAPTQAVSSLTEGGNLFAALGIVVEIDLGISGQGSHGCTGSASICPHNNGGCAHYNAGIRQILGGGVCLAQCSGLTAETESIGHAQVAAVQLDPLVGSRADTAPVFTVHVLDTVNIQSLAIGHGVLHGAGIAHASTDINLSVSLNLDDLLQIRIGSGQRNGTRIHFHIRGIQVEGTALGAASPASVDIGQIGHTIAAIHQVICVVEGRSLCKQQGNGTAGGRIVGIDHVLIDPAGLGCGGLHGGLSLLGEAAHGAGMLCHARLALGGVLHILPGAKGMLCVAVMKRCTCSCIVNDLRIAAALTGLTLCIFQAAGILIHNIGNARNGRNRFLRNHLGSSSIHTVFGVHMPSGNTDRITGISMHAGIGRGGAVRAGRNLAIGMTGRCLEIVVDYLAALRAGILGVARGRASGRFHLDLFCIQLQCCAGAGIVVIAGGRNRHRIHNRAAAVRHRGYRHGSKHCHDQQSRKDAFKTFFHDVCPPIHFADIPLFHLFHWAQPILT